MEIKVLAGRVGRRLVLATSLPLLAAVAHGDPAERSGQRLTLDQALSFARHNSHLRQSSAHALAVAQAQYRQALSSRWPSLTFSAALMRRDEDAVFKQPGVVIPLGLPQVPPIQIPDQKIKLLDRDVGRFALDVVYPLYTGGERSSVIEQANLNSRIAATELQRTELEVERDVRRYYLAADMTRQMRALAADVTESLAVVGRLAKSFYEGVSHSVTRLDYLRTQLALSAAKSLMAEHTANHREALAALTHAMGMSWSSEFELAASEPLPDSLPETLRELVAQAKRFNPEINKLTLATRVADAGVSRARSGYFPKIALTGSLHQLESDFSDGLTVAQNRHGWTLGLALEFSVFDGGLTRARVDEAASRGRQLDEARLHLERGVAATVKSLFLKIGRAEEQRAIAAASVTTAEEHKRLSTRAYRAGAVATDDMLSALIYDSLARAARIRAEHDLALHRAELDYVLGTQVAEL